MTTAATTTDGEVAVTPLPPGPRRLMMTILVATYVLSYLDRQIVTILAETIKRDLRLADWQIGAVTGLAFAVFYTGLGVPLATLSQRFSRPHVIGASMVLWSFFTMLCGRASNFLWLLVARIGVGFGEAGCNPNAHSLICDYVPRERRASFLALFSLGVPLGTLFGLGIGGVLADMVGWRTTFLIAGLPGILLGCVAAIVLPEPRARAGAVSAPAQGSGLRRTLGQLRNKPTFWLAAFGAAGIAFVGNGHSSFIAPFFLRAHGDQLRSIAAVYHLRETGLLGILLGLAQGGGGLIGTITGGWLADRAARVSTRGYTLIPACACLLGAPIYILIFTAHDPFVALSLSALASFFGSLWYGPVYAIAQSVVPPSSRPLAAAILIFIFSVIGIGFGPLVVGVISDALSVGGLGPVDAIRWSLISVSAGLLLAAPLFFLAGRTIDRDIVG